MQQKQTTKTKCSHSLCEALLSYYGTETAKKTSSLWSKLQTLFMHSNPSTSLCLDLPPPPEPPPEENRLEGPQGCIEASSVANGALSSLERSEYSSSSHQRKGSGQRHTDSKAKSCRVCRVFQSAFSLGESDNSECVLLLE